MLEIDDNFCFCYENGNSQQCQDAYGYYKQNNPGNFDVWGYDNQTVIFLDTNILLETYFLSKFERASVVKFITNNKNRIVISSQVDSEYLKHRLDFISGYDKKLTQLNKDTKGIIDSCLKSLNGEAIGLIRGLASNHLLKFDFSDDFQTLKKIIDEMQTYLDCLKEDRERLSLRLKNFQNSMNDRLKPEASDVSMYMEDELLMAIAQCNILSPLSERELKFVKEKYNECLAILDEKKTDVIGRYRFAFPGCGDRKKEEKEGRLKESDMIIYHEMLKYMKQNDKNVIFLTFDLAKGDWTPNKAYNDVFLHYVENQYLKTGHVVYIKSGDELPLMFDNETELVDEDSDNEDFPYTLVSVEDVDLFGETSLFDTDKLASDTEKSILGNQKNKESAICEKHRNFRKIDAVRFMSELQTCTKWADEYGAGFVGRDYFIYGLLGRQKHFEFNQSRQIYNFLKDSGKVREIIGDNGDAIIQMCKE